MPGENSVNTVSTPRWSEPKWVTKIKQKRAEKRAAVSAGAAAGAATGAGLLLPFEIKMEKPGIVPKIREAHRKNVAAFKKFVRLGRKQDAPALCEAPIVGDVVSTYEGKTSEDEAMNLAREALDLARTGKKRKVERARELFEEAGEIGGPDPRVEILEAGFHVMLGEYGDALDIYSREIKRAKKQSDACTLEALSYDLVNLDLLLSMEMSSIAQEKKKESFEALVKVANFAMNPLSIVGNVVNEIASDIILYERPEYKPEELVDLRTRSDRVTASAVKALEKMGAVDSLSFLSDTLMAEFNFRTGRLESLEKMSVLERTRKGIYVSDADIDRAHAVSQELLVYYWPMVSESVIDASIRNENFEELKGVGDEARYIAGTISDMSSFSTALKEQFSDLAVRALSESAGMTDDRETLLEIARQLVVLGRFKEAAAVYGKISVLDPESSRLLNCALLSSGEDAAADENFDDIVIIGLNNDEIDETGLKAAVRLVDFNAQAVALAVSGFYRSRGYRAVVTDVKRGGGGELKIHVREVVISRIEADVRERGLNLRRGRKLDEAFSSWLDYMSFGKISGGQHFSENELNSALKRTNQKIGTYSPIESDWDWQIDGDVLTVSVPESRQWNFEIGGGTTTSGREDLIGMMSFMWKTRDGRDVGFNVTSGRIGDENGEVNGSAMYRDPDLFRFNGRRYSGDFSAFKQSNIYDITMTGASAKIGEDLTEYVQTWTAFKGYELEQPDGTGNGEVYSVTSGMNYRDDDTFFTVWAGPGIGPGGWFLNTGGKATREIEISDDWSIAITGYGKLGNNLPASEKAYFGKDQTQFKGYLSKPQIGSALIGAGIELRHKMYEIGESVVAQPYTYIDVGSAFDIGDGDINLIPVAGFGVRVYAPYIGWMNFFLGWRLDGSGAPQPGFTFGYDGV